MRRHGIWTGCAGAYSGNMLGFGDEDPPLTGIASRNKKTPAASSPTISQKETKVPRRSVIDSEEEDPQSGQFAFDLDKRGLGE